MERSDPIARLEAAAAAWVGTPWCDDSEVRGRGVCCHRLVAAVYREAGWLPGNIAIPSGAAMHARGNDRPIMREWFTGPGAEWFDVVEGDPQAGDALLIRVGHTAHHMGLRLSGDRVLSVTTRQGVRIVRNASQWLRILDSAFRPRTIPA